MLLFIFGGLYPGNGQVHSPGTTSHFIWCNPWLPSFPRPQPSQSLLRLHPAAFAAAVALRKDPVPQPAPPSTYSSLPFPSLQNGHPHFVLSPLSATPAKQGLLARSHRQLAVPRSPILWVPQAAAPHDGALPVPWGGAAATPPHSAFPAVGGIHGQGEIRPRGRDSTGCTEDLFIAQDGWLQVVWLGGTVAVILFMMCFQNLSKQKTTKNNNKKTPERKWVFFQRSQVSLLV